MRIYHRWGLELPAGVLRTLIPNKQATGASSGQELVRLMRLFNMRPVALTLGADASVHLLSRSVLQGVPPIVLGYWVSPLILHWVLVVDTPATGVVVNDPWGGVRRFIPTDLYLQRYAGVCIV